MPQAAVRLAAAMEDQWLGRTNSGAMNLCGRLWGEQPLAQTIQSNVADIIKLDDCCHLELNKGHVIYITRVI